MDALQLIKDNLDIERILEYYKFSNVKPSGNKMRACCKLHDGDNPTGFVIDVETGLWSCHTSDCGKGDVFHLIQKLDEVPFPQAVLKVADILDIDIEALDIVARTSEERKELRIFMNAMKKAQDVLISEYEQVCESKNVTKYLDFDKETIEKFGLVYFKEFIGRRTDGSPLNLEHRLGFPIIKDGIKVGYSLRATKKGEIPKWVHQPTAIRTAELLYNYDAVIGASKVAVVEGITDVWAFDELGIPAVCTYGASISDKQKRLLLMLGADLVLAFDGDLAGRTATISAYEMFKNTTNMEFVSFDEGTDPASIPRTELLERYNTKTRRI